MWIFFGDKGIENNLKYRQVFIPDFLFF